MPQHISDFHDTMTLLCWATIQIAHCFINSEEKKPHIIMKSELHWVLHTVQRSYKAKCYVMYIACFIKLHYRRTVRVLFYLVGCSFFFFLQHQYCHKKLKFEWSPRNTTEVIREAQSSYMHFLAHVLVNRKKKEFQRNDSSKDNCI